MTTHDETERKKREELQAEIEDGKKKIRQLENREKVLRHMKKTDLRKAAGISSSSLAKLGKDENVTTDVLLRICKALDCELDDIVEIERTEE